MIPRNRKITEISKYGGSVPIGEFAIDLHDQKPLNLNTQVCEGNLTKCLTKNCHIVGRFSDISLILTSLDVCEA